MAVGVEVRIDHSRCELSVTAWHRAGHASLGRDLVNGGREVAHGREQPVRCRAGQLRESPRRIADR